MKNRLSQCLIIVLFMAVSCYGANVNNLLINGSFELTNPFVYPGYSTGGEIIGWDCNYDVRIGINPASNGASVFNGSLVIPDGAQVAFLQSHGVVSTISQPVDLTAGDYTLSWYEAKRPGTSIAPDRTVSVTAADSTVIQSASETVTNETAYVNKTMSFTIAVSGTYTVSFSNTLSTSDTVLLLDGIALPKVYTPMFNPARPSISGATDVTISCATDTASIYYTLNGSAPTTGDTLYVSGSTITVNPGDTLQAVAVLAGYTDSDVASQTYVTGMDDLLINGSFDDGSRFAYPGFANGGEIPGWVYNYGNRVGINPDLAGAVVFNGGMTILDGTQIAFLQSHGVVSTLSQTLDLAAGDYLLSWYEGKRTGINPIRKVTVTDSSDTVIQSSSAEVTNSDAYMNKTMAFTIATSGTYTITFSNLLAEKDTSLLLDGVYLPKVQAPVFEPAMPYISGPTEVSISCPTESASIYYTLNGGVPTTGDTLYTVGSTITVNDGDTLQAIAVCDGYPDSDVASQTYQAISVGNLMVNGSFEEGDGFPYPGLAGSAEIPGWVYNYGSRVGVNPATNGASPFANWGSTPIPDGARTAFLQSNGVVSTLSQSVDLVAGDYTISWYEARRVNAVNPVRKVAVTDSLETEIQSSTAEVINSDVYVLKTMDFTIAVSGTYTITFSNTVSTADTTFLLDGVLIPTVAVPVFDPVTSYLSGPTDVTISCATAGASIYYTLDGSEPTTDDNLYVAGSPITVNGGDTLKAIGVLSGFTNSVVASQSYEFYPIVEARSGSVQTTGSAAGFDLVLQNGSLHVDGSRYQHILLSGTISNWTSDVSTDGTGVWSDICMLGTDYFVDRNVPADVDETMSIFSYADDLNYGASDKQRGFAANGGLVMWKGAAAYSVDDGFAAEDCFPDPLGGHSTNLPNNLLSDPSQFEYEIDYDLDAMILTVKVRDVGDADWDYEATAILGCRNNYSLLAADDDWSDLVFSVQSSNNLVSDTTTYGFDYTIQMQISGIAAGDANLDGAVDVGDLGILAANYGTTSGATWNKGDFNGDGAVDVGDLGILAANYGSGSSSANFDADYAKLFGTSVDADEAQDTSSLCGALGLPLVAGLLMMGLMLIKLDD